jgi:hypothetical protein
MALAAWVRFRRIMVQTPDRTEKFDRILCVCSAQGLHHQAALTVDK